MLCLLFVSRRPTRDSRSFPTIFPPEGPPPLPNRARISQWRLFLRKGDDGGWTGVYLYFLQTPTKIFIRTLGIRAAKERTVRGVRLIREDGSSTPGPTSDPLHSRVQKRSPTGEGLDYGNVCRLCDCDYCLAKTFEIRLGRLLSKDADARLHRYTV